jgi:hypothetical protein
LNWRFNQWASKFISVAKSKSKPNPPAECPACGAEVPRNARACPECGADDETGWNEDAAIGGCEIPDDSFDYDKFLEDEELKPRSVTPRGISKFWWIVAVVVLLLFLFLLLAPR